MDDATGSREPIWAATPEKVREAVNRIVQAAHPLKVIVFGSHARGEAGTASDVDILVVERDVSDRFAEIVRLNGVLRGLIMAVDLLVIGQEQFEAWSETPGSVYYTAKREGKVVYEAA